MNERLKQIREYYQMSMRDLASKLGMSSGAICMYESGDRPISKRVETAIVMAFPDVNPEWFATGEGDMIKPKTRESELADIVNQMLDADDNDFRLRLTKILYSLSEEQLELLAQIGKEMFSNENSS